VKSWTEWWDVFGTDVES